MEDIVLSNHVYEDLRYMDPRLLPEGYDQQLQRLGQAQTCYDDEPAREWIMAKQMMSCAFLQRITTDQKFLVRKSKKLSSNFVLRPSKVEGSPSQMKRESYGFKGLLSRNTSANYVNTSSRRKKLAMCFNWNQVKNPEVELKLRKKWIQENKTNEFKDSSLKEKTQNTESTKNALPELNSDLKKVYGSPIFITPFHRPKKPTSCNFQPTVTGIQLRSHSEHALKEPGESASGDNVTSSKTAVWKKFRGCHNKPNEKKDKTENKTLLITKTQTESKQTNSEFTDISDALEEKKQEKKKSIFGRKTLVEVFTPITKALSSSSHERSSSAETYRTFRKCSNEAHTSDSSSSFEASSPVHHCSEIDINQACKLSAAKILNNINQTYFSEGNLIPATSLGPVKSKMNERSSKNPEQKETANNNESVTGNKKVSISSQSNAYKLPALLQNGLRRLSLTFEDADDEASTHRRGTTDEQYAAQHQRNLDPKDALTSAGGSKRKKRVRSKERKRTLDIEAKDSSSIMLPEQEKRRKPRRKRKPRKNIDGAAKPHETIGSEGDDEWEEDSDNYGQNEAL